MKSILLSLTLVLVIGFVNETNAQSIVTGSVSASQSTPGYNLHKNNGDRFYTKYVQFEKPFEAPPEILVFVNLLESKYGKNLRYDVQAEAISRDGFTVKIKTWGDSQILLIGVSWMAIPKELKE